MISLSNVSDLCISVNMSFPDNETSDVNSLEHDIFPSISVNNPSHVISHDFPSSSIKPSSTSSPVINNRHFNRTKFRPNLWTDYHVPFAKALACQILEPDFFNSKTQTFYAYNTSSVDIKPNFYHQAVKDPRWVQAMQLELQALEENKTWSLVPLPPDKTVVGSKWVYKIKYKSNGDIERYKVRLVAKGYTQSAGIDFHETYAQMNTLQLKGYSDSDRGGCAISRRSF
ncbi:uncharacterized protein LOC141721096 [Apium graveolens]|uniref:uncharacterized protein LOC141721096 n=1 Tax=Apium graveolens TaxID=4045 RepID=UPI003D7ACC0B